MEKVAIDKISKIAKVVRKNGFIESLKEVTQDEKKEIETIGEIFDSAFRANGLKSSIFITTSKIVGFEPYTDLIEIVFTGPQYEYYAKKEEYLIAM